MRPWNFLISWLLRRQFMQTSGDLFHVLLMKRLTSMALPTESYDVGWVMGSSLCPWKSVV